MKNLLVVCLILSLAPLGAARTPRTESFTLAEMFGEIDARAFFVFSTSAGNYIVRHDGFGEFTSPTKMRRVFMVRVAPKSRIDRLYFLEHEHDVFLVYEVRGQGFYVVRMEQTKRKVRWSTTLGKIPNEAPMVEGNLIIMGDVKISKSDGRVLS